MQAQEIMQEVQPEIMQEAQQEIIQVVQQEIIQEAQQEKYQEEIQQEFYCPSPPSHKYLNLQHVSPLNENDLLEQGIYLF